MEKNEILMIYGKNYKEMTKEILTSAKLARMQIGDKKKKIGRSRIWYVQKLRQRCNDHNGDD